MLAQPTVENLLVANEQFYRTFETLEADSLTDLWETSDRVYCLHPGWSPLVGYEAVIKSFRGILMNTKHMQFHLTDVQAHLVDNVGVVTLIEHILTKVGEERHRASAAVTNLFKFDLPSGAWKIFHHHASPGVPQETPPTVVN